jgi:CubicO group peptidase (beta-lactamase class C family)
MSTHLRLSMLLAMSLASNGVSAQTPYPHAQEPIGTVREVYDGRLYPDLQVNTFRNIDRLFPVRAVKRGEKVRELPLHQGQLESFSFESDGKRYDLYDVVSLNRISGLLVLKKGEIAYERYFLGNTEDTRWMSMSVVKSVCAMLIGAAIRDGFIDSVDDPLTRYLPQLEGSAYQGVSVKQVLQMTSGAAWNETYTDPESDRRRMLEAQIDQQPGAILELMAALPRAAEPGTRWNYSTGETHIAGALIAAATGRPVADYLSEAIWTPMGMESDATWWLESPGGLEVGGSGLSATLRDYARFGLYMLDEGVIDGQPTLPDGWVREAATPSPVSLELDPDGYGYFLWPLGKGTYSAIGIFGQFVYVDPTRKVVIAMWSAQSKPVGREGVDEYAFMAALAAAVE